MPIWKRNTTDASQPRVGVALGGGGARGLAHLGVLRILWHEGVTVRAISGTSIGALVGGAVAHRGAVEPIIREWTRLLESDHYNRSRLRRLRALNAEEGSGMILNAGRFVRTGAFLAPRINQQSLINPKEYFPEIDALIPDVAIEELKVPFSASTLDVVSGREVVLTRGSLRRACYASAAIPALFPPIAVDDMLLVDGSWVDTIPAGPARRLGAQVVIAVDVAHEREDTAEFTRGLDILLRANALTRTQLKELQLRDADVVIRPKVDRFHWADFGCLLEAIEEGERATRRAWPQIEAALGE